MLTIEKYLKSIFVKETIDRNGIQCWQTFMSDSRTVLLWFITIMVYDTAYVVWSPMDPTQ